MRRKIEIYEEKGPKAEVLVIEKLGFLTYEEEDGSQTKAYVVGANCVVPASHLEDGAKLERLAKVPLSFIPDLRVIHVAFILMIQFFQCHRLVNGNTSNYI